MWLKIPYDQADAFNDQPELLFKIGLDIPEVDDIRDLLIYAVIDEFVYVKIGVYNLQNRNRKYPPTREELDAWDQFLEIYPEWVKVDTTPLQDQLIN